MAVFAAVNSEMPDVQGTRWLQLCSARHDTRRSKGISAVRFASVLRKWK